MRRIWIRIIFAVSALVMVPSSAFCGGPFLVDTLKKSGKALRWQNDTLKWCADEGKLSSGVSNATAIQWVTEAFNTWTTGVTLQNAQKEYVPTTTVKAQQDTSCKPGDIDSSNHKKYTLETDEPPTVIFDEDGGIIEFYVGKENVDKTVGLTYPGVADSSGLVMTKGGFTAFNGKMLTNGKLGTGQDAIDYFRASMQHELGHLLNLDHSQVNYNIAKACTIGNCPDGKYVPTMHPELLAKTQATPTRDDKVTISWIYPTAEFQSDFCTITGEIFDANGKPLKGVNVIAASTVSPKTDARAMVSGVMYPECDGDSRYYLYGIKPGVVYQVTYEPIGAEFIGYSDFEPLENPPQGFASGTITTTSDETTVSCSEGGQTIEMASKTIDAANYCTGTSATGTGQGTTSTGASSSTCTLVAGGIPQTATLLEAIFVAAASVIISRARIRTTSGRSGKR